MESTIVNHPERAAIEGAMRAGVSVRQIEDLYGVSRMAVQRYKKHLPEAPAAPEGVMTVSEAEHSVAQETAAVAEGPEEAPALMAQPELLAPLTQDEKAELSKCEAIITVNLAGAQKVWRAFMTIRDKRLYRQTHTNFEDYCRATWGIGRNYVERQIRAADLVAGLVPIVSTDGTDVTQTLNEGQARALLAVPQDNRQAILEKAVNTAHEGKVTAKLIREVAKEILKPPTEETDTPPSKDAAEVSASLAVEPEPEPEEMPLWERLRDSLDTALEPVPNVHLKGAYEAILNGLEKWLVDHANRKWARTVETRLAETWSIMA